MAREKQHVFSARTTEEGLKQLNGLKAKLNLGWDDVGIADPQLRFENTRIKPHTIHSLIFGWRKSSTSIKLLNISTTTPRRFSSTASFKLGGSKGIGLMSGIILYLNGHYQLAIIHVNKEPTTPESTDRIMPYNTVSPRNVQNDTKVWNPPVGRSTPTKSNPFT